MGLERKGGREEGTREIGIGWRGRKEEGGDEEQMTRRRRVRRRKENQEEEEGAGYEREKD